MFLWQGENILFLTKVLVSWSSGSLRSRKEVEPCWLQVSAPDLPSSSPDAPALLSGNASPVPAGPSLPPPGLGLLLLSKNRLLLLPIPSLARRQPSSRHYQAEAWQPLA